RFRHRPSARVTTATLQIRRYPLAADRRYLASSVGYSSDWTSIFRARTGTFRVAFGLVGVGHGEATHGLRRTCPSCPDSRRSYALPCSRKSRIWVCRRSLLLFGANPRLPEIMPDAFPAAASPQICAAEAIPA